MKIRKAKLSDTAELAKLISEIIAATPYYSKEAIWGEIKDHNYFALDKYLGDKKYNLCLVAEEDKKIIGFINGRGEAGVFWADWLGVKKTARRSGVGERLMKELESILRKDNIHKIWCDSRNNNKESINLLLKLKYKKLGLFKNAWYKQDFFLWQKDI